MKIGAFVLMTLTFVLYCLVVKAIWQLVSETRASGSTARFNRFWWLPAWKVHRAVFPESPLRRRIVRLCGLCYLVMCAAFVCFVSAELHRNPFTR